MSKLFWPKLTRAQKLVGEGVDSMRATLQCSFKDGTLTKREITAALKLCRGRNTQRKILESYLRKLERQAKVPGLQTGGLEK